MGLSLRPNHLKRAAEIAAVLVRHGRRDVVTAVGLADVLSEAEIGEDADPGDAAELVEDLERLGPTFVKLGQLLSTRPDLVPAPYVEALERLQDDVDPLPIDEIAAVIEDELQVRLSRVFPEFDEEPLAAGSLAQVHRARLRDGREVAVKVQRPGIRAQVRDDLDLMLEVAAFADAHTSLGDRVRFADMIEEFRRTLARELDFRREATNLEVLAAGLAEYDGLVVPVPVEDLTTSRVLTMSYVSGRRITAVSPLTLLDVDGETLADELFRAYLKQILADGFVHADPHPGNVLLTDDGRLALVDVGMVVRLEPAVRERLIKLLVSVSEGKGDDAATTAIELGEPSDDFDEASFRRDVVELVGTYRDLPPADIGVGGILTDVARIAGQTGLRPPVELTLLARTLSSLDHVGRALAPDYDANAAIQRNASQVLTAAMVQQLGPSSVLRQLLDVKELVEQLPARANAILGALAEGTFRVSVDAIDEDRLIRSIRKLANRLTAGLVLAALIIGAAMLMRVETQARLLGYPAVAIIFFLVAATGGFALVITILLGDRDEP